MIDQSDPHQANMIRQIQNVANSFALGGANPFMPGAHMPSGPMMGNESAAGYNPDVFEYDEEMPDGEIGQKVILDAHGNEIGMVKTIGTG